MILLKDILEGRFRDRKGQIHLFDTAMFSVFADDTLSKKDLYNLKRGEKRFKMAFERARQQIHSVGFPSMHSNVIIKDLSKHPNQNTGDVGVGGYAQPKGKFMAIDAKEFRLHGENYLVKVIVHEWAHLWMFNNSKEFKRSVKLLYNKLLKTDTNKIDIKMLPKEELELPSKELSRMINRWGDAFSNATIDNDIFKHYAIIFTDSKEKILKIVPMGVRIRGKAKQSLYIYNFHRNMKTVNAGDSIYAEKGRTGWIIGLVELERGNTRFEAVIPPNEIQDYMEVPEDLKGSIEKQKSNPISNEIVENEIVNDLMESFDSICYEYNIVPSAELTASLKKAIKDYVVPKAIQMAQDENIWDNMLGEDTLNKIYDYLWTSNELKPESFTITNIFKELYKSIVVKKYKDRIKYLGKVDLVGKEYTAHREIMKNVNNWTDSYGMSNADEVWATGIEEFFKLPPQHRKAIIKLMMGMGAS